MRISDNMTGNTCKEDAKVINAPDIVPYKMFKERPGLDMPIEFDIWPKFAVLWFKMYFTDHNEVTLSWRAQNPVVIG